MVKIVNMCVSNPTQDKFLFLKRNKPPFKGYFGMLGGKIKDNEEPKDAACRELFEESGIISEGKFLGKCYEKIINSDNLLAELEIYFFHFIIDENIKCNSGSEGEVRWISIKDFGNNKLIPSDPLMIDAFFNKEIKEVISVIEEKNQEYFQKEFDETIAEKIRKFVRGVCDGLEHGDEWYNNHFSSVVKYSKTLSEKSDLDSEVVEIAAWLHDVGSILHGREDHHITGAEIAEAKLREIGYPEEKIKKVKHCILSHRGSKNIKRESIEAEILADADSMSHFDEIGGLFKYEFIIYGINFKQREAQRRVREKLERSYNKLSENAKKIIQPKFEAAMLLLGENEVKNNNGKIGVGVGVMLLKDNKVLLGKRHIDNDVSNSVLGVDGCWTMPGGKLEYGESFEECAKREVLEECGIKINKLKILSINNDKSEKAHFATIGFFSEDFEGEAEVMEPEKITEWEWFFLDDLPFLMYFPSAKMIENYNKNKFYLEEEII